MRKTFKQFLMEAPLPDDWDSTLYNDRVPFTKRVNYAKQRALQLGQGSSRVAFKIPYQGRDTVLKVAKNAKGMAQNEHEVQALNDYYLRSLEITIPIIDYDESSNKPTWIHMEMAEKVKPSDFKKATGGTPRDLIAYALAYFGQSYYGGNPKNINEESETVQSFIDYVGNYSDHIIEDYSRLSNWGLFQGRLVIVDIGLSSDIYKKFY